jgi:hypothetical protein
MGSVSRHVPEYWRKNFLQDFGDCKSLEEIVKASRKKTGISLKPNPERYGKKD